MSTSKKIKFLIIINLFLLTHYPLRVKAQTPAPVNLEMSASSPCNGSNHLIKFIAGGACQGYPIQWNMVGPNFIKTDAKDNWIEGYFTTSGTKTIGFSYYAAYREGGCKSTSDYYEQKFNIFESNISVGTVSGTTTLCPGSQAKLSVSSVTGNILGWQKRLPGQAWSAATTINNTTMSISTPDIEYATMDYRIMVGSVCAATVYSQATVTYVAPVKPGVSNPPGVCGQHPEVSVTTSADQASTVIHLWFYSGQSTPFHSDPATYKGYGNNIFESKKIKWS